MAGNRHRRHHHYHLSFDFESELTSWMEGAEGNKSVDDEDAI
jgi:hypothetical protein